MQKPICGLKDWALLLAKFSAG